MLRDYKKRKLDEAKMPSLSAEDDNTITWIWWCQNAFSVCSWRGHNYIWWRRNVISDLPTWMSQHKDFTPYKFSLQFKHDDLKRYRLRLQDKIETSMTQQFLEMKFLLTNVTNGLESAVIRANRYLVHIAPYHPSFWWRNLIKMNSWMISTMSICSMN